MANGFYWKLAVHNVKNNRVMYGPYFFASTVMSAVYFIILNVVFNRSIANMSYGATIQAMFTLGIVVMTLFAIGYIFYINGFLIRRRKKEFALYGILGLEKRHVLRIIIWENVIVNGCSLIAGLLSGAVLGKLVMFCLLRVLSTAPGSYYQISLPALLLTCFTFGIIFIATTCYNALQVHLARPVDLLHGAKKGEKKLRGVIPLSLLGLLILAFAYILAIVVESPGIAISLFWPDVILVIIATWLLFVVGCYFVLSRLQKNKKFYYRPENFITVSGLLHRLRRNASGLANICILSTMVIVTVSCCTALFFGQESILRQWHPADVIIGFVDQGETAAQVMQQAWQLSEETAAQSGLQLTLVEQLTPSELTSTHYSGIFGEHQSSDYSYLAFNVQGNSEEITPWLANLLSQLPKTGSSGYIYSEIFSERAESYALYGGLLFLGVFFALLFLTNTVLIIYFRQVSESYDDRRRFVIMQQVGMDDQAVKQTIQRQIRTVFLLPLLGALLHAAAASPMLITMLEAFQLYNSWVTLACVAGTGLAFIVFYLLVCKLTARTCYSMLKC